MSAPIFRGRRMSQTLRSPRHEALTAFIIEKRKNAGLTQAEVARRLKRYQLAPGTLFMSQCAKSPPAISFSPSWTLAFSRLESRNSIAGGARSRRSSATRAELGERFSHRRHRFHVRAAASSLQGTSNRCRSYRRGVCQQPGTTNHRLI